jgi:hypothetical protein
MMPVKKGGNAKEKEPHEYDGGKYIVSATSKTGKKSKQGKKNRTKKNKPSRKHTNK